MSFKISDIVGKRSSFTLQQLNVNGVPIEIFVEPCTAGRLLGIHAALGDIENLLATPSAMNICKIATYLLADESREHFLKRPCKIYDLDGGVTSENIGGWKLLMNLLNGVDEQLSIYVCILQSFGWSKEKSDKMAQEYKDAINGIIKERMEEPEKKKELP